MGGAAAVMILDSVGPFGCLGDLHAVFVRPRKPTLADAAVVVVRKCSARETFVRKPKSAGRGGCMTCLLLHSSGRQERRRGGTAPSCR